MFALLLWIISTNELLPCFGVFVYAEKHISRKTGSSPTPNVIKITCSLETSDSA